MSRAACNASVASAACKEPTCLCASPLRLRMKTSQSGVLGVAMTVFLFRSLRDLPMFSFLGVGGGRFAHPGALVMGLAPRRQPVAVTGAVAGQHLIEFFPVDRAIDPVARRVLLHAAIGNREPQELRLRHGGIDKFLPQLVIGEALDLPSGRG